MWPSETRLNALLHSVNKVGDGQVSRMGDGMGIFRSTMTSRFAENWPEGLPEELRPKWRSAAYTPG